MLRSLRSIAFVGLFVGAIPSWGRVDIVADAVKVRADRSTVNFRTGKRVHRGNVLVEHGNFQLRADEVIENREKGKIITVRATGTPARFRQAEPYSKRVMRGFARKAEYRVQQRMLFLWEYSVTDIDGNTQQGGRAKYQFAQ